MLTGGHIAGRTGAERSLRAFAAGLILLALFTAGSAIAGLSWEVKAWSYASSCE